MAFKGLAAACLTPPLERELIVERTNAGLAAARARGRMGGRPRKVDVATLKMAMTAMSDPKSIATEVAKKFNIKTAVPRHLFSQKPRNKHVICSKRGNYFHITRVTTQKHCVFREL